MYCSPVNVAIERIRNARFEGIGLHLLRLTSPVDRHECAAIDVRSRTLQKELDKMINVSTSQRNESDKSIVSTVKQTVRVKGERGLTMLACSRVVQHAEAFVGKVLISNDRMSADGHSMLELLQLAAEAGTVLSVEVIGPDAVRFMRKIAPVLASDC